MTDLPERGRLASESFTRPFIWAFRMLIFRGQVIASRQQLLVHRPRDVGAGCAPRSFVLRAGDSQLMPQEIAPRNRSQRHPTRLR
jgi:hypothetical protein